MSPQQCMLLDELVSLIALERLEVNLFRGQSQDLGWGTVFGGQVLGQALSAATQTVPTDRFAHSLHGYFLRPGRVESPVIYEVDRIRDGRSFTTRRVLAIQNGEAIFSLSASFQVVEPGYDHQATMPEVAPPEQLASEQALMAQILHRIPKPLYEQVTSDRPIEVRPVDPQDFLTDAPRAPQRAVWFKARGQLPDQPSLHQSLLAYASDFHFLTTSLQPHGLSWLHPHLHLASVDHVLWFHRPFRMDEWLLHVVDSPSASGARGFVRGQFFNRAGQLIASTAQEGLIRDPKLAASAQ